MQGSITPTLQNEGCVPLLLGKEGFPQAHLGVMLQWDVCTGSGVGLGCSFPLGSEEMRHGHLHSSSSGAACHVACCTLKAEISAEHLSCIRMRGRTCSAHTQTPRSSNHVVASVVGQNLCVTAQETEGVGAFFPC